MNSTANLSISSFAGVVILASGGRAFFMILSTVLKSARLCAATIDEEQVPLASGSEMSFGLTDLYHSRFSRGPTGDDGRTCKGVSVPDFGSNCRRDCVSWIAGSKVWGLVEGLRLSSSRGESTGGGFSPG